MKQFWCLFLCLLGIIPVVAQQELYTQNPLVDHYVKQQLEQGKIPMIGELHKKLPLSSSFSTEVGERELRSSFTPTIVLTIKPELVGQEVFLQLSTRSGDFEKDLQIDGLTYLGRKYDKPSFDDERCYWRVDKSVVTIKGPVTGLQAEHSGLIDVDLANCPALLTFYTSNYEQYPSPLDNQLKKIDLGACPRLQRFDCTDNGTETINMKDCEELAMVGVADNNLKEITFPKTKTLSLVVFMRNNIQGKQMDDLLNSLYDRPELGEKGAGYMVVAHPDKNFEDEHNRFLVKHVDAAHKKNWKVYTTSPGFEYKGYDHKENISQEYITLETNVPAGKYIMLRLEGLNGADYAVEGADFYSKEGGKSYYAVTSPTITIKGKLGLLECVGEVDGQESQQFMAIDISNNPYLEHLDCHSNKSLTLDISKNPNLKVLNASGCKLADNFSLVHCSLLQELYVERCGIAQLNLQGNTGLVKLNCSGNSLKELDVRNNPKLEQLFASNCGLLSIDVRKNKSLKDLRLDQNNLTELYLDAPALFSLSVFKNRISSQKMAALIETLPNYEASEGPFDKGQFVVFDLEGDNNVCLEEDVYTAQDKNWETYSIDANNRLQRYQGIRGIVPIAKENRVEIYPNPAAEYVFVASTSPVERIEIFSTEGVLQKTFFGDGSEFVQISLDGFSAGTYFLQVANQLHRLQIK